jgi:hypothetical protein
MLLAQAGSGKASPNRYFVKAYRYQTKMVDTEDQGDASHGVVAIYRPVKQCPREDPRRCRAYVEDMPMGRT